MCVDWEFTSCNAISFFRRMPGGAIPVLAIVLLCGLTAHRMHSIQVLSEPSSVLPDLGTTLHKQAHCLK